MPLGGVGALPHTPDAAWQPHTRRGQPSACGADRAADGGADWRTAGVNAREGVGRGVSRVLGSRCRKRRQGVAAGGRCWGALGKALPGWRREKGFQLLFFLQYRAFADEAAVNHR
jgi:hypothetical protein